MVGVGEGRNKVGVSGSMVTFTYTKNAATAIKMRVFNSEKRRFGWRIFHRLPLICMCLSYHQRLFNVKNAIMGKLPFF